MTGCKLTNSDYTTRGGCLWGPGVEHEANGEGDLCGPGWIHYYEHPLLAVLHNPIHGDFPDQPLWECDVLGTIKRDGQMKSGTTRLRTTRIIEMPTITTVNRVAYGILAAKQVYDNADWNAWADKWLSGEDRTTKAARAALVLAAARAAAHSAKHAAWAAEEATWAAEDAAWAAEAAARAAKTPFDLIEIAEEAMRVA